MKIYSGIALFLMIVICGCEKPIPAFLKASYTQEDYDKALTSGISGIEVVREFELLYPDAEHFITHYAKELGGSTWNSKVGLQGRYVLTVQLPIDFDESRHIPSRSGEPKFHFTEVESIETLPDGRLLTKYKGNNLHIGAKEWDVLTENQGRLESIGVDVKNGGPVPGFETEWKNL
ncbi:MAG: hypothetical protein ABIS50_00625 [Luteolibacter sp.]|uniref:hypothetical protein n=1 Tax=Luteolibacter sp. TaxID=1962973 RepID=UPI0032636F6C